MKRTARAPKKKKRDQSWMDQTLMWKIIAKTVVVAQMAKRSLLTPWIRSSNPSTNKTSFLSNNHIENTKISKKRLETRSSREESWKLTKIAMASPFLNLFEMGIIRPVLHLCHFYAVNRYKHNFAVGQIQTKYLRLWKQLLWLQQHFHCPVVSPF